MNWISKHSTEHKANLLNEMPIDNHASKGPHKNDNKKKDVYHSRDAGKALPPKSTLEPMKPMEPMPVPSKGPEKNGKRLKKKIMKLSDKHAGLHSAVVEGHGQNKYTSGNYDADRQKLYKVEDKLEKKEKKYTKKFGKSPYEKKGWIQEATASIKRRGTEGVCTGDKFGSASCPPGSKRYNLAKTFKKMAKNR